MSPERITCVNITRDPDAIEWLSRPTLCLRCGGEGSIVSSGWHKGIFWAAIETCPGCAGMGFAVWFSWN